MAKRLKVVTAGPLHYEYLVPVTVQEDKGKRRSKLMQVSSAAQQFMNLKNSWRELELMIAQNFRGMALVVTLTYSDALLPKTKPDANKRFQKFVRKLRATRRAREEDLLYLYATECFHGREDDEFFGSDTSLEDHRMHHHVIINATGNDYEEIRSLWEYGEYIRIEPLDIHYLKELAKYMTKEAREFGRGKVGERTWNGSRNLKPYEVEYDDVRDSMTLTAPPGAIDFSHEEAANPEGYGEMVCTRYLLLDPEPRPVYSYSQGRRKRE